MMHLGVLDVDGRIILNWTLVKNEGVGVWAAFK
jgi:hypothetical protein